MFRSSNPIFKQDLAGTRSFSSTEAMTVQGTVNCIGFLLVLVVFSASWVWNKFFNLGPQAINGYMMLGLFGGFITALITVFKKDLAKYTAAIYALFEGLFLGGISAVFEANYPGIVIQAVGLTFGVMFTMLFVYKSGIIKVNNKFRIGIIAATGGIALIYLVSMIMGFFGGGLSIISSSSPLGIGFSFVVVAIAAFNLVLDFDYIEQGAAYGLPKDMQWYFAFGLIVTLVWLYIEILRLISKLNQRR